MIELKYTGFWSGCDKSDLKLECIRWDRWHDGEPIVLKKWEVVCDHMEACERWQTDEGRQYLKGGSKYKGGQE